MKLSARIHDNGYAKEKLKSLNILTLATQCLESWPALLGFAVILEYTLAVTVYFNTYKESAQLHYIYLVRCLRLSIYS